MNEKAFLQTTAQLNNQAFLEEVYRTYLKRDPDTQGQNFYLHKLRNGEVTRSEIVTSFLN